MVSIPELCDEHRELAREAALLLRVVQNFVPDAATVAMLRWRLARKLGEHCAREDAAVYAWLIASGDGAAMSHARQYREEHARLASDFTAHIEAWSVQRIANEWDAFRAETEKVVRILNERIQLEERTLYPHVDRLSAKRRAA